MKDYSRKIKFTLLFIALFVVFLAGISSTLYAETYEIGGKSGWSDVQVRNGITTGKGRFGHESLTLDTNSRKPNQFTDMLLDFEDGQIRDKIGNYKVVSNNMFISERSIMGKGAALSRGRNGGIVLEGEEGSFFNTQGHGGSFLIDFWICPSVVENGEVIFKWRSSRNIYGTIVYQLITATFYQDKIMCILSNMFDGYSKNSGDIFLNGRKKLVPGKWSQHSIAFTEDDGMLVYKVNGEVEDVKFITDTEHESGTVYNFVIGKGAKFEIGPEYIGLIDDFSLMRSFVNITQNIDEEDVKMLNPLIYNPKGGRFESVPILTKAGSIMNSLEAEVDIPLQTEVLFYMRSGDNFFGWTSDFPKWIPVKNGEPISNMEGLYFQVAVELFPDGNGEKTPSVTKIDLNYTTISDPQPPHKIFAKKGDSSVTLSWAHSVDDSAGGYYIFYGTRPGEYLGRFAVEGYSPINVGNATSYTLSGLNNGTIYYFAIAAWSKNDERIQGPLSKEVYARPGF